VQPRPPGRWHGVCRKSVGTVADASAPAGQSGPISTKRLDVSAGHGRVGTRRHDLDEIRVSYGSEGWGFESLRARGPQAADLRIRSSESACSCRDVRLVPRSFLARDRRARSEGYNAARYAEGVIRSFGNPITERLWSRERTKKLDPRIERTVLRKLVMLDAAETLDDLRVPPGNRLEALRGDRAGQHSIRINQQWRICFTWTSAGPNNVEIVDYH
jgi:toxin HigB-1